MMRSLEIVAILAEPSDSVGRGLWWVYYKARGQRCGVLCEIGVSPFAWLPSVVMDAEANVAVRDGQVDTAIAALTA